MPKGQPNCPKDHHFKQMILKHDYNGKNSSWSDTYVSPPVLYCTKCGKVKKVKMEVKNG